MSKRALWRPLETMGLKFGSHSWVPCSYLGGASDQTFFRFFQFFFVRKNMGPLPKIVAQIRRVFGFGGGLPWDPLGQILGRGLAPPPLVQILGTCHGDMVSKRAPLAIYLGPQPAPGALLRIRC